MRLLFILILPAVIFGCKTNSTEKKQSKAEEKPIIEKTLITEKIEQHETKKIHVFDKTIIPETLLSFVKEKFDSLYIPTNNDYESDYFYEGKSRLPFYCSGYFNNDTLRDYAMVLIKDSLNHFAFSFHRKEDTFEHYLLAKAAFLSDSGIDFTYAELEVSTEKERILEAIDTTYTLNNDAINITYIYNSRSFTEVWDEKNNEYETLIFD